MARTLSHLISTKAIPLSPSKPNPSLTTSPSSSCRPLVVAMAQSHHSYWASIETDIEAHLKTSIPDQQPASVFDPMRHLTFAAPKTRAPSLCVAACELVGGHRDQAMAAASALHLVHSAAYAHEHLPLTDRPVTKPLVRHAYGPNIELLTGDGIVPFGFELLARSVDPAQNNSDRILRVIIEITRAVGSQGMVDGQYQEMQGTQSNNSGRIEHVCKKKEGELHACGAACGAILGGGSEEEIEKLRNYGLYVGMIEGMVHWVGGKDEGLKEVVEGLRALALKELEKFEGRRVEIISSFVEANLFCNA